MKDKIIIEKAPAKINLGLFVLKKRDNGYHDISTIMYPINDFYDIITISISETLSLTVPNHIELENEDNLVFKAYNLLKNKFNLPPVKIVLEKNIPYQAGLGGGSSDAVATLKALNKLFNLGLDANELLKFSIKLGSDCPFFVYANPLIAEKQGDILTTINLSLENKYIYIFLPYLNDKPIQVSTTEAYSQIKPNEFREDIKTIIKNYPMVQWKYQLKNDFLEIFINKYPFLYELIEKLYELGAIYVNLSGSGSAILQFLIIKIKIRIFINY